MVLKAMDAIGVTECIYVGDSEVDVRTAKNAGVPCLSVLWGFRDREQIGGTVYCETVNCLVPMLEEMACGKLILCAPWQDALYHPVGSYAQ